MLIAYKVIEKAPTAYSDKKTTTEQLGPIIIYATSHNVLLKNLIIIHAHSRNKSHNNCL